MVVDVVLSALVTTQATAGAAGSAEPTPAIRPKKPSLWRSNLGLKIIMAVTGLLMLLFLIVHMLGNLKVFFGLNDFNHYAAWLRTILSPLLPKSGYLWIQRVVLVLVVVAHFTSAYVLARRAKAARSVGYVAANKQRASYATFTMRWGGVVLLLFIIYHILDLSTLTLNPNGVEGDVYQNVVADFSRWWITLIYILAMLALGIHIDHGFWSAALTLGANKPRTLVALKITARTLAVVLTVGFIIVPLFVLVGVVK